jgi:tellurite resistance protein
MTSTEAVATTAKKAGSSGWSLPISLFSIPLGIAGLGGAWTAAAQALDVSDLPAQLAYAVAAVIFVAFTLVYVVGTIRHESGSFHLDLRHPLTGPLTAYLPVVAILLIANYADRLGELAPWLIYVSVAALAINAAQQVAHWLKAPLDQDALHPGYFLPVVAGPFIASVGLVSVDAREAAIAVFGVGIYFWLLLGAVITSRLFVGSPLPPPFRPVLSILLSPPGVASVAWFAIADGRIDQVQAAVGGITLFMLLVQLVFLPDYLRLPFSAQHWVFTFPLATVGNAGVRWAAGVHFDGWQLVAWIILAISTVSILAIVAGTLRDVGRWFVRRSAQGRPA